MKKKKSAQKIVKQSRFKKVVPFIKQRQTPLSTALAVFLLLLTALVFGHRPDSIKTQNQASEVEIIVSADNISLPTPDYRSSNSLELVLKNRRTRIDFSTTSFLSLKQVSQLLWAAQGVNVDWGDRTAPSAKSTYPLTIYLLAMKVDGLEPGEYQYIPGDRTMVHQLKPIKKVDLGKALFDLLNQSAFKDIPAVLVIAGDMTKMADAYGGIPHDKEVYLEAGYTAQNISLEAESLRLGTSVNTNFDELKLKELVTTADDDTIINLMPIGIPK